MGGWAFAEPIFTDEMVGPNALQEVKDAWMDAAKETNANGMGIRGNGMMSHISQMMVQRLNKQLKGETENFDILGSTVESAVQATKKALYDLEHPVVYTPRSIEIQQARIKEGKFYELTLDFYHWLRRCIEVYMERNQAKGKTKTALSDVTLNIPQGEIFCIMGSSGSGKSTLLKILGGY